MQIADPSSAIPAMPEHWSQPDVSDSGVTRRGLLGNAVRVLTLLALSSLLVFKPARQALADGYDEYTSTNTGPCGTGGYAENHDCDPICGPSSVCGHCCDTWWHKSSSPYALRPNQCFAGFYDSWRWKCGSTTYRCHDGYYIPCSVCATATICRKAL